MNTIAINSPEWHAQKCACGHRRGDHALMSVGRMSNTSPPEYGACKRTHEGMSCRCRRFELAFVPLVFETRRTLGKEPNTCKIAIDNLDEPGRKPAMNDGRSAELIDSIDYENGWFEEAKAMAERMAPRTPSRYPAPVHRWYLSSMPSDDVTADLPRPGFMSQLLITTDEDVLAMLKASYSAGEKLARYFAYDHLQNAELKAVSRTYAHLALNLIQSAPGSAERTVALRKLLESKDCAVRAALPEWSRE